MRANLKIYFENNPLWKTLRGLEGNPRACVFTEPLWGIAFALYSPYLSVYMHTLGVTDLQIGIITTLGFIMQVFSALFGGLITDRIGRRLTTFIFDILSWTVPLVVFIFAQNFYWFLIGSAFNALYQVTNNSWTCLLVEDAKKDQLVYIFTWVQIAGLLSVFFAPLAVLVVSKYDIIVGVRLILIFATISMTMKFVLLFFFTDETRLGKKKRAEMKSISFNAQLKQYGPVLRRMVSNPAIRLIFILMVLNQVAMSFSGVYFGIYITENLGVSASFLSLFPMLRAILSFILIFTIQTRLNALPFKIPFGIGLILYVMAQVLLIGAAFIELQAWIIPIILIYTLIEALATSLVVPQRDSFLNNALDEDDRARELSIIDAAVVLLTAPFALGGAVLVQSNRITAFIITAVAHGFSLLFLLKYKSKPDSELIEE